MDASDHSRDSSYDASDPSKHRECDDMMVRRTTGHMPAALRKKKQDDYKKFITPTGSDPMEYLRQHMRSKSMSDLEIEKKEKDMERDQRNIRYEEIQQVKEQLKEEEEVWTSKLQNWKTRRRSATLDAWKRKEDRETLEHQQQQLSTRKPKTYKEILEDKKRREMDLFDENDPLNPGLPPKTASSMQPAKKKMPYRGAISVPSLRRDSSSSSSSDESDKPEQKKEQVSAQPVRYTSKVTAVINHVPAKSTEEPKTKSSSQFTAKVSPRSYSPVKAPQPRQTSMYSPPRPIVATTVATSNASRPRSQSPPSNSSSYSSQTSVVMRRPNAEANRNKPRPKSEFGYFDSKTERAQTLPRNYHKYSAPKPYQAPATSMFQQKRKTAFANKRNMWENMSQEKKEPASRPSPQHLSALLKQDNPHGDEASFRPSTYSHSEHSLSASQDSSSSMELSPRQDFQQPPQPQQQTPPWQPEVKQSSYRTVTAPSWPKAAAQPSQGKPYAPVSPPVQAKTVEPVHHEPITNGHVTDKPKTQESAPTFTVHPVKQKLVSPRVNANSTDPLFDDMKICINQRPRSEKGFGFTVRGGDDGKPVIVNTVSPGGAADICQLCVGDEILAINDVRLDSSLTQDGIVQLIVDSVITGNLSLDIRRYGKAKKTNPLRLSGTKVVMTPRGFVQVRSDKGKTQVVTTKMVNGNAGESNNEKENHSPHSYDDLPPPPDDLLTPPPAPAVEVPPQKQSAMSRLSPKQPYPKAATLPASYRTASPLTDLIQAAQQPSSQAEIRTNKPRTSNTHIRQGRYSSYDDEEGTDEDEVDDYDMKQTQYELDVEESYIQAERQRFERDNKLRKQLMEEQRSLEEHEAKREEEKRKRMEEARLEEIKLEEELRRIDLLKQQQQKKREEERRRLLEDQSMTSGLHIKTATKNQGGGISHWLIEEAERSRQAEEEGRRRPAALDYKKTTPGGGALPDHVIQHLTKRNGPAHGSQRSSQASNAQLPETLTEMWNDPNTQATLL